MADAVFCSLWKLRTFQGNDNSDVLGRCNPQRQNLGIPGGPEIYILICNKKIVSGEPPNQLSEFPAFTKELQAKNPKAIAHVRL